MLNQPEINPLLKLDSPNDDRVIYFFGARHTNNIDDGQFKLLKKFWDEFLSVAKGPKLVFVEGSIREIPEDYEEAIRQYGEAGAVQWLARAADVDVIRPELGDYEQRKLLCISFNPENVAYSVIIQNLSGWFRHTRQSSFDEAVERSIIREKKFSEIYGFTLSKEWLYEQHRKLFNDQELEDKNFLNVISDPRIDDTPVNIIVATRTKIRNEHIFDKISQGWKSGKSVFIVYGKGHLESLKSSIEKLNI